MVSRSTPSMRKARRPMTAVSSHSRSDSTRRGSRDSVISGHTSITSRTLDTTLEALEEDDEEAHLKDGADNPTKMSGLLTLPGAHSVVEEPASESSSDTEEDKAPKGVLGILKMLTGSPEAEQADDDEKSQWKQAAEEVDDVLASLLEGADALVSEDGLLAALTPRMSDAGESELYEEESNIQEEEVGGVPVEESPSFENKAPAEQKGLEVAVSAPLSSSESAAVSPIRNVTDVSLREELERIKAEARQAAREMSS